MAAGAICLVPAYFLSSLATDAELIESNSFAARRATIAFYVVAITTMWHIVGSLMRGGRIRNFLASADRYLATSKASGFVRRRS